MCPTPSKLRSLEDENGRGRGVEMLADAMLDNAALKCDPGVED